MWYKLKRILIYPDGVTEKQVYPAWNGDLSKIWTPTSFTLSSPIVGWRSIVFSKDGRYFYISWYKWDSTNGGIQQYECSTPRDITTASISYNAGLGTTSSIWNYPRAILANEWQYYYYQDYASSNRWLVQYSLGTAWDLSSTKTQITKYSWIIEPVWMSEDGKKFIRSTDSNNLYYSTSNTAWAINTSWTNVSSTRCCDFSIDGTFFYTVTSWTLTQYSLATPFDPTSTKTQIQQVVLSNSESWIRFDTYWNNLYTIRNNKIYQYSLL